MPALFNKVHLNSSRFLLLLFLVTGFKLLPAQEMLGIVNSNYAGITGSVINPAVSVTSPFYIDLNVAAGDFFVGNNYLYLAKDEYRFRRFLSLHPDFPTHGTDNTQIVYDYYNKKNKNGYVNARLLGPSFSITVGRHSFGFVSGARAVMSMRNVPYHMAKYVLEQLKYPPLDDINHIDTKNIYNSEMAWVENGFNYSYVFKQNSTDYWAAGITVKDLRGLAGAYLYTTNVDYKVPDSDTLIVNNIKGEGGYSLPLNYQSNSGELNPLFRGKGLGVDIGVIYQKKKTEIQDESVKRLCAQAYISYQYKIGVSILDIGRVRFTENAEKIIFDNASTFWPGLMQTHYTSVRDLTDLLSNRFYGNPTQLIQGNEIKIALPTAISFQADVNYYKNWFINGTFVSPLQFSKSGLRRPALLAVTPRYETALFEASLPLTIYDWTKPRIGLSARFMGFFIGTEKLSGFFHFTDFTGLDFYFGLKFYLRKGFCHTKFKKLDNCGIEEYRLFNKKR